jgi:uncharacterized repeat protein (TIGR03843 family)
VRAGERLPPPGLTVTADDTASTGPTLEHDAVLDVLTRGALDIEGRMLDASNATLVAHSTLDGTSLRCVYKPVAGERPLWDFPDETLGHREVAAYEVSAASPWSVVPPTVWREDGPFGPGMCQLWVDTDDEPCEDGDAPDVEAADDAVGAGLVDIVPRGSVPPGWRHVLLAQGSDGRPVELVHADHPALRAMAVFDAVVNNADRKGGHVLVAPDGAVRGVDHGVSFSVEPKLRTVLWGWAGEPVPDDLLEDLAALRSALDAGLGAVLATHLSRAEVRATARRVDDLLVERTYPLPSEGWPAIPWPAF